MIPIPITCIFKYIVVVGAIWTVDIGLDSSAVELLTRVTGVLGLIHGPAICFQYSYFPITQVNCYSLHFKNELNFSFRVKLFL